MWRSRSTVAAAIALLAMGLRAGADDPAFVFTSIDVPGAIQTVAFGINARGEVVGFHRDASNRQHGFLLGRGGFRSVDFPGAILTDARGISPNGEVVGAYRNPGEPPVNGHGYRLSRAGDYVPVDYPGHTNTIAQRIGPDGTIFGCSHDQDTMDSMHGVMIRRSDLAEMDMGTSMHNGATPDRSTIVGLYTDMDTGRGRAYLLRDGEFIPFDAPGSRFTAGWDINPSGEAVGVYQDASSRFHGFVVDPLWNFTTLDFPGGVATRAFGINARGDVVGSYVDTSNRTHGFLARRIAQDP